MSERLLLTIQDAADTLSCSSRLVEKLIASGELQSLRIGKRARRLTRAGVIDYIVRCAGESVGVSAVGLANEAGKERVTASR